MYRDFQSRLGTKMGIIARKLSDNAIELTGSPVDCIRIRTKRKDEGDIISQDIVMADVVSVIFPPLKDVPYRKIIRDAESTGYAITSIVTAATDEEQQKMYQVIAPHNQNLTVGDCIYRVFLDPDVAEPIILGIVISETLGSFGQQMLVMTKFNATIQTENLSEKQQALIIEMAQRHLKLTF